MNSQMNHLRLIQTDDGSQTLQDDALEVTYRSTQGAKGESQHVFLGQSGLQAQQRSWSVFELGFGGGRNCWETLHAFLNRSDATHLLYVSVDHAPISMELFRTLLDNEPVPAEVWQMFEGLLGPGAHQVQRLVWSDGRVIELQLYQQGWEQVPSHLGPFDVVFHDPFGPQDNPQAWTEDCFRWEKSQLKLSGRLVTYGAAGHVRRNMEQAGFIVGKASGFGRKREMTVAVLDDKELKGLKRFTNTKTGRQS